MKLKNGVLQITGEILDLSTGNNGEIGMAEIKLRTSSNLSKRILIPEGTWLMLGM